MNEAELLAFQRSVLDDPITQDVWRSKYRFGEEDSIVRSRARVVSGVYTDDSNADARAEAMHLVQRGILIPAGRVNAGAGTGRRVTLNSCYVNEVVQDSMPGIARAISRAALTLQQGGGIGTAWGTVRPAGAIVRRTSSVASGTIPFMRWMNAMAATAASAGDRRGAMMGTLPIDHPDLYNPDQHVLGKDVRGADILTSPSFLSAKTRPGELTFMNISVLVTDAFMKAVEEGTDWDLGFHVPRADSQHVAVYDKPVSYDMIEIDENLQRSDEVLRVNDAGSYDILSLAKGYNAPWYVYQRLPARQLWDEILRTTYKYAEPGVIFIDRVNDRNNLRYCEDITATNPCGEQPLGPDNVCCLGSVNLAFLVQRPFTPNATIDYNLYYRAIKAGVRFLDNVLDVTNYPLEAQREASMTVRRIGLGITGFGDALVQLGIRYGSEASVHLARHLSQVLQVVSYTASVELAKERGPFPAFDAREFDRGYNVRHLPKSLRQQIHDGGIRNGVLNTIAPNGTISLYVGNVSSGHEPVFSFAPTTRKIRQPDDTVKDYEVVPYSLRLWRHKMDGAYLKSKGPMRPVINEPLPDYFVGALDLTPEEHLVVHGAWSEHIDAAVSKTINCPASMSFDDFRGVYSRAYALGAKGATTYRPDPESGRGSVLSEEPRPTIETDEETNALYSSMPADTTVPLMHVEANSWGAAIAGTIPNDHINLAIGHCIGCGRDTWIESGKKYICSNCHKHVLLEMTKEAAQALARASAPEDPRPAPEAAHEAPTAGKSPISDDSDGSGPPPRPEVLDGKTYKLKWPVDGVNWYVTVTNDGRRVRELFIAGGDPEAREWVEALSRTTTAVLRRDGDVRFLVDELERVTSAKGGAFVEKRFRPSVVAAIGGVLREEIERLRFRTEKPTLAELEKILREDSPEVFITPEGEVRAKLERRAEFFAGVKGADISTGGLKTGPFAVFHPPAGSEICRKCGSATWVREAGCQRCLSCGEEVCG
jgi:ribonucleoside-diphosphate reductase alpha chain